MPAALLGLHSGRLERNPAWSLLTGAAAGVVGTIAMDQFQRMWARAAGRDKHHGAQTLHTGGKRSTRSARRHGGQPADPTEKVSAIIAESVFNETLRPDERDRMGTVVHYAFGTGTGALYGLVADRLPWARAGGGAVVGLAVWLGAEVITMQALGLSR